MLKSRGEWCGAAPLRSLAAVLTVSLVCALPVCALPVGALPIGAADDRSRPSPLSDSDLAVLTAKVATGDDVALAELAAHGPKIVARARPLLHSAAPRLRDLIEKIVRAAIRTSIVEEGAVRYAGQFAELAPLAEEGAEVLLDLFRSEDETFDTRGRAATALGDIGGKAQIPALVRLADDYLAEAWVEREAIFLLAKFGDRERVDRRLAELTKIAEQATSAATIPAILTAHGELAEVHYRIAEYDTAIRHYNQKQALLEEMLARVRQELRAPIQAEIDLLQYNRACSLSLGGRISEAFAALDRSMESREITLEMVRTDGDLRAVRADARYAAWLSGWQQRVGERKAEGTGESPPDSDPPR